MNNEELREIVREMKEAGATRRQIQAATGIGESRIRFLLYDGGGRTYGAIHRDTLASRAEKVSMKCLRCKMPFLSWDRVKNRMCVTCARYSPGIE